MEQISLKSFKAFNTPCFRGESKPAVHTIRQNIDCDRIELSSKENKKDYKDIVKGVSIAGIVSILCILAGRKILMSNFDKISCGIKKGDIKDEFFNFIQKNDPKGEYFNDKNLILELNKNIDEEKFLILKKLFKMKNNSRYYYHNGEQIFDKRFSLNRLNEILNITNKDNISHLEELASKQYKPQEYTNYVETMEISDIKKILKLINNENSEVSLSAIKNLDFSDHFHLSTNITELINSIKKINKENSEAYKIVYSTRKAGERTELKFSEIDELAELITEHKNPKIAELALNAKKQNGTNNYFHSLDEVKKIIENIKDEKADILEELQKQERFATLDKTFFINNTTQKNINEVKRFMNMQDNEKKYYTFQYADQKIIDLANITSKYSEESMKFFEELLSKITLENHISTQMRFPAVVEYIANEKNIPKIREALNSPNIKTIPDLANKLKI